MRFSPEEEPLLLLVLSVEVLSVEVLSAEVLSEDVLVSADDVSDEPASGFAPEVP